MRYPRSWLFAAGCAPLAVLAGLTDCAGSSGSTDIPDGGATMERLDATCGAACGADTGSPSQEANDTGSAKDADASGSDTGDVPDAPSQPDGPTPIVDEVCRVNWTQVESAPQPIATLQVAVDPSGNTYVAEHWGSNLGMTIVKVDPACHVLWTREMRAPADAGASFASAQLTVAADSSVLLAGAFYGTIDFGTGPVDGGPDDGLGRGFLERLAPDGSPVYLNTYGKSFPGVLSPDSAGLTSLLVFDYAAYLCGNEVGCADGGAQDGGASSHYFVQVDAAGHEVSRRPFAYSPEGPGHGAVGESLDSDGGVWILENQGGGIQRLTESGDVLWQQPTSGFAFGLVPSGGVVLESVSKGSLTTETLRAFGFDGGALWMQSTTVPAAAGDVLYMAIGPAGTIYVGGGAAASPQVPEGGVAVQVFDSLGHLGGLRVAPGNFSLLGYTALGVDPSGNAVVATSLDYEDGGFHFALVKLGP
jgi:hypothetical protein